MTVIDFIKSHKRNKNKNADWIFYYIVYIYGVQVSTNVSKAIF